MYPEHRFYVSSYSSQGASYDEYLTKNISVLVCNDFSLSRDKIHHALEWGIPAVRADWLWDCIRSGQRESFDTYLIQPTTESQTSITGVKKPFQSVSRTVRTRKLDLVADVGAMIQKKNNPSESGQGSRRNDLEAERAYTHAPFEHAPVDSVEPEVKDISCPGDSMQLLEVVDPPTLDPLGESLDPGGLQAPSFPESDSRVIPLQEFSSNSPPKPHHNSGQPLRRKAPLDHETQHDSLTTAISSLLAQHQRDASRPPRTKVVEATRLGRRKRQLFGRAPSNLSACSNGTASLSRASSVDTMNTDGLGTPLETTHLAATIAGTSDAMTVSLLANLGEDETEKAEEKLPSTQLGYEDPEAGAWRERLMNRMANGNPGASMKITTPKAKSIGTVKDTVEMGLQSVSKRTRQAGGR